MLKQTQEYNYHFGILIVHTPVVGQLDYKLALFLIFLRDSHIAFIMVLTYISTHSAQVISFLFTLTNA